MNQELHLIRGLCTFPLEGRLCSGLGLLDVPEDESLPEEDVELEVDPGEPEVFSILLEAGPGACWAPGWRAVPVSRLSPALAGFLGGEAEEDEEALVLVSPDLELLALSLPEIELLALLLQPLTR